MMVGIGMETSYEERIARFKKIIDESNKIVFFGGAGVSTASGIPDFRSSNGLYNTIDEKYKEYTPEYYLSSECFHHNPKIFYQFYRDKMDARNYRPNNCHKVLYDFEKKGKLLGIVTQNIDMLHEAAGNEKIYKIHGTIGKNHCIKCGKEYGIDFIFDSQDVIPKCNCGKEYCFVKPDVVLYGENLPNDAFNKAMKCIENGDLLIIAGTSLQVNPAASMVSYYYGKNMVIINRESTGYDSYADIVFREDINDVFKDLM